MFNVVQKFQNLFLACPPCPNCHKLSPWHWARVSHHYSFYSFYIDFLNQKQIFKSFLVKSTRSFWHSLICNTKVAYIITFLSRLLQKQVPCTIIFILIYIYILNRANRQMWEIGCADFLYFYAESSKIVKNKENAFLRLLWSRVYNLLIIKLRNVEKNRNK